MRRSIISIAAGRMPAEMIAETASPAASVDRNAARCVVTASGLRRIAQRDLRRDPERALGADEGAEQVRPVRVEGLAAELDDLAVRQHDGQARDVVDREAVLEAVGATRVLGDVAADRADLLARGIGRVEEPVRRDGAGDVEIRDARLDHDPLRSEVDLDDPLHPRERDHDAVRDRQRPARRDRCPRRGRRTARPRARRRGRRPAPPRSSREGRRAPASRASP